MKPVRPPLYLLLLSLPRDSIYAHPKPGHLQRNNRERSAGNLTFHIRSLSEDDRTAFIAARKNVGSCQRGGETLFVRAAFHATVCTSAGGIGGGADWIEPYVSGQRDHGYAGCWYLEHPGIATRPSLFVSGAG